LVWVQSQAAIVGPPVVEWLAHRRRAPGLDLDDATYIPRPSSVFGAFASMLKGRGKTDRIIRLCDHAVCGNPTVAAYIAGKGVPTTVLPTLVATARFTTPAVGAPGEGEPGWV